MSEVPGATDKLIAAGLRLAAQDQTLTEWQTAFAQVQAQLAALQASVLSGAAGGGAAVELVLRQQLAAREAELATARRQVQTLTERNAALDQALKEARRAEARQAARFRRRQSQLKAPPKQPGRRRGQGRFGHRARPATVDQEVAVPLAVCPQCGSPHLTDVTAEEHVQIDLPRLAPVVTRFTTQRGYCAHCQATVSSRHPAQLSTAVGAAGVCLGPRVIALAADLHAHYFLSYAKIAELLQTSYGLTVTRSALCQAVARLADRGEPVYAELLAELAAALAVNVDETGWRINTLNAWLWVFATPATTVYTIRSGEGARGHETVLAMLGADFAGALCSDGLSTYDYHGFATWLKQKCLGHLLADLKPLREEARAVALAFAVDATALLRRGLALKRDQVFGSPEFIAARTQLETDLDQLLTDYASLAAAPPPADATDLDHTAGNLVNRLRHQRPHLWTFLYHAAVAPTNNRAERQLRPAVGARKTQHCNKTAQGAHRQAVLASILATLRQRQADVLDFLIALQAPLAPVPHLPPAPVAELARAGP